MPDFRCGGTGSVAQESMWNLWWTKWHFDKLIFPVLQFSPFNYQSTNLFTHLSQVLV